MAISWLADRQHGVVARRQLLALGVTPRSLDRRLARRILVPLHRGVSAFGHRRLSIEGRWLAAVLAAGPGAATLGEADRRGLLDVVEVERALRRMKTRHGQGHRRLVAALDAHRRTGAVLLRSELEERFLDLVLCAGLPRPRWNARIEGFQVDALWPDERLVVELDGWAHHKEREAAARDRDKTNRLQVAGYVVLRFMHADLVARPAEVAAAIRSALQTSTVSSCE